MEEKNFKNNTLIKYQKLESKSKYKTGESIRTGETCLGLGLQKTRRESGESLWEYLGDWIPDRGSRLVQQGGTA